MIIKSEDILRHEGEIKILELGGAITIGFAKVSMHQPTGVVFTEQRKNDVFDRFIVGVISDASNIDEKREYPEKSEESFFKAVAYFEELIQKRMPPEDESQPSVGKFYFYKKSVNAKSKVIIDGMPEPIIIDEFDIPLIFTPPQKKPYGRLDVTKIDKVEYQPISSKYALKYNKQASEEQAKLYQKDLSDVAVYDMTPYSNSEKQPGEEGEENPEEVNEKDLSLNDIEGEDLDDNKNKEKDKKDKKDNQSKKDSKEKGEDKSEDEGKQEEGGDEDSEQKRSEQKGSEQKGEKGEDAGEEGQEEGGEENGEEQNSEQERSEQKRSEQERSERKDEKSEQIDEETDEEIGEETDEETDKKGKVKSSSEKNAEEEEIEEEIKVDPAKNVSPSDLIKGLEKMFKADKGLVEKFKTQRTLTTLLQGYNKEELNEEIYKKVGLPNTYSKMEFIELVKQKTNNLFN